MDGSSRPPVDVAIDQRLDDLQRTLLRLLARRRRHSWVDDPELKKVLATLYEHVCEARRLHSISDDGKREVADRALARLVDADETQLRELDAARAVADGFKQALVQFGTAEYCNVLLAAEDRQRTDDRGIAMPSPERAVEECSSAIGAAPMKVVSARRAAASRRGTYCWPRACSRCSWEASRSPREKPRTNTGGR